MIFVLIAALWAFIALSVTDAILTRKFLALGVKEGNPVMAFLIEHLGPAWAVVKCSIAFAAVGGLVAFSHIGYPMHAVVLAGLAVAVMVLVCARNWRAIKTKRSALR
jgi:hypothetical protein